MGENGGSGQCDFPTILWPMGCPRPTRLRSLLAAGILCLVGAACAAPNYDTELPPGARALIPLGPSEAIPDLGSQFYERPDILPALERSVAWLKRPHAARQYPVEGISHERALRSVERLAELLRESGTGSRFQESVEREFQFYRSAGYDGRGGGVLFTAYYTPIFEGRRKPDGRYRYPLYAKPKDLQRDPATGDVGLATPSGLREYPSRQAIESGHMFDGQNLELVYLSSPMEAYICHVQGSAYVHVEGGELLRLGYGGTNGREYTSLAQVLVEAGQIPKDHSGMPDLLAWAERHPDRFDRYAFQNKRYTFFTPIEGTPHGSLDVPVTPYRSLATDKRGGPLFPPGTACVAQTRISTGISNSTRTFEQLMFDQDTGGGIRTAGRADIYVGIGDQAGEVAGRTQNEGQLYYLFLRPEFMYPQP